MLIYLESWQWECCGDQFHVGSTVEWELERADGIDDHLVSVLGPHWAGKVEYAEDHHELMRDGIQVVGRVRSIDVLTTDHEVVNRTVLPIPSSGRLDRSDVLDAWAPGLNHHPPGRMLDGWLVDLELAREPTERFIASPDQNGD